MTDGSKAVQYAIIEDCFHFEEKRSTYIFAMRVQYVNDPNFNTIHSTYEDFNDFHLTLVAEVTPAIKVISESDGQSSKPSTSTTILPKLPLKPFNMSDTTALTLMRSFNKYLQELLNLPPRTSRSPTVRKFFKETGKHAALVLREAENFF